MISWFSSLCFAFKCNLHRYTLVKTSTELGHGSFFGELAVLHFTTRLETCVTTRSSNMLSLGEGDMEELCQLSFEFKAELMTVALERMRWGCLGDF